MSLSRTYWLAMTVNVKRPLVLSNTTKFFEPSKDKSHNIVASQSTYSAKRSKIKGYEARLYWQFKECERNSGQTFFYTLTYSDRNLPVKYGVNCFDYEDLRDFLTGGFRKMLLRKYGTIFKYFIGAELGEGAGKRGFKNNPHYHILFFLESAKSSDFPYLKISPFAFRSLVRLYWQGFDQDLDKKNGCFHSFEYDSKYGIAKEGENLGLVTDYRACGYCAKYVCKDVNLKMKEANIASFVALRSKRELLYSLDFHKDFVKYKLYPLANIPVDSRGNYFYNDYQLFCRLLPNVSDFFNRLPNCNAEDFFDENTYLETVRLVVRVNKLNKLYKEYLHEKMDLVVNASIAEWRNRYCNKCRISHGVGDLALKFVEDLDNPTIEVPSKNGFKRVGLNLYYYRKLFTRLVPSIEHNFANCFSFYGTVRVLNEAGLSYKVKSLQLSLGKLSENARNYIDVLLDKPYLFNEMRLSDLNTRVFMSYDDFIERLQGVSVEDLCKRYAEYKRVYEYRFCRLINYAWPVIDVLNDYRRFIVPSVYSVCRSELTLEQFLKNNQDYYGYENHPYFLPYLGLFSVLDLCADFIFVENDTVCEREYQQKEKVRKFHVKQNLNFYQNVGIICTFRQVGQPVFTCG